MRNPCVPQLTAWRLSRPQHREKEPQESSSVTELMIQNSKSEEAKMTNTCQAVYQRREGKHTLQRQRVPLSRWLSTNELGGNCQGHWKGAGGTISGAHARSGIVSVPTSLSGKTFYYAWSHTMQRCQENITSRNGDKTIPDKRLLAPPNKA